MRLGVITDEVSQDFEVALDFAKTYGLDCVELRSAYEKGPFDYTEEDILAGVLQSPDSYLARVACKLSEFEGKDPFSR